MPSQPVKQIKCPSCRFDYKFSGLHYQRCFNCKDNPVLKSNYMPRPDAAQQTIAPREDHHGRPSLKAPQFHEEMHI